MKETGFHHTIAVTEKYKPIGGEMVLYERSVDEGNVLLNEGINNLLTLAEGAGGNPYSNATAFIGVGDSATAAAAAQTGLQAASNKAWAAMEATFPTFGTSQQIVFKASFASGVGNFEWLEYSVGNSNDDSGENLNRATFSKGTKVVGEVWTLTVTITLS